MNARTREVVPLSHTDRFFVGGKWTVPSSASSLDVIDPTTEQVFFSVAEAQAADMSEAVGAARDAFDNGPWPRMTPAERAEFLRAIGSQLGKRSADVCQVWPRQSGALYTDAAMSAAGAAHRYGDYADMADTFPFIEHVQPTAGGEYGLIVREPAGVVGAIVPWNAPIGLISFKLAPALLAGCTVILKASPEAPAEAYMMAEIADAIGLPPGVLNVVTADREVSELLVRDHRVDKITFTGSTAAGQRIAALCGERVARCTLELGGKSAAVILDDMDLDVASATLAKAECFLTGQACSSLTRIIVTRSRHDELLEALAAQFAAVAVGDPFDAATQMGPLAASRHRERVENYIAAGRADGATLAAGGKRPKHLDRGWFIEPTVFGNVDNASTIAQEEIFGPVLSVIPADDEDHAVRLANDTIYGLNASVFTNDADRAYRIARQIRSGTVGHNAFRSDFGMAFGGFKQSGIGREGGREGVYPFLETKSIILDAVPQTAV